jgi:hypothetical protein
MVPGIVQYVLYYRVRTKSCIEKNVRNCADVFYEMYSTVWIYFFCTTASKRWLFVFCHVLKKFEYGEPAIYRFFKKLSKYSQVY